MNCLLLVLYFFHKLCYNKSHVIFEKRMYFYETNSRLSKL